MRFERITLNELPKNLVSVLVDIEENLDDLDKLATKEIVGYVELYQDKLILRAKVFNKKPIFDHSYKLGSIKKTFRTSKQVSKYFNNDIINKINSF